MKVLIVLCAVVAMTVANPGYLAGGLAAGLAAPGVVAAPGILGAAALGYGAPGLGYGAHALGIAAPVVAARAVPAADAVPAGLAGITPNGVPVDTPAVQAGKAANAVAHASANSLTLATAAARGVLAAPALGYAGAGFLAAPALGYGAHGAVAFASAPADVVPAGLAGITPNGVPVDTPAVQAARAADAAAHLNAKGLILG